MATAGTGFAAGLRAGGGLVSQALENERLDEAADRQRAEFERKKVLEKRADDEFNTQQDFRTKILAASQGSVDPATGLKITDAYGATPAQQAKWQGEPGGLPAKLATMDVPDNSELPGGGPNAAGSAYGQAVTAARAGGAAAPGLSTTSPVSAPFSAADVKQGAVDQVKLHDLIGQAELAKGNYEGYTKAKAAGRAADVTQTLDSSVKEFMAMPEAERMKRAWSPNLTGNVPLLTTAVDKNGMTVLVVNKDGSTDGKPMKLSWADAAQLHAAEQMASKGYGAEAIDTATKVNTRIGEAVKAQNDVMQKVATSNTDAAYKGAQIGMEREKIGIMRSELGLKQQKAKADSTEVLGVTNDGILNRSKTTGAITLEPFPKGLPDDQKQMVIKKYRSIYEPKISNDGQSMTLGPDTYAANPNYGKDPKSVKGNMVNTTDQWLKTTPGSQGDGASALAAYRKAQGEGGGAAAPAAAAPAPAAPAAEKPGLNVPRPDIQPAPGSKVAKMREQQAAATAQRDLTNRTNVEAAQLEAPRVLASGDRRAAYNLMRFDGFDGLPPETKMALSNLANGR